MHFPDLAPCHYHRGPFDADEWDVPLRAIGFLEHPHPFDRGPVPAGFLDRFDMLARQTRDAFSQYVFRGLHECDLCIAAGVQGRPGIGGSAVNVLVPGAGEVFMATGALPHYVTTHGYRPPQSFVDAVMACPSCESPEYLVSLRRANADAEPPLEFASVARAASTVQALAAERFRAELGMRIQEATRDQAVAAAARVWPDAPAAGASGDVILGRVAAQFDETGRFVQFARD